MTLAEDVLWQQLRARRFRCIKFRRQVPVGPFIADFLSYERKLVIEVDGDVHCSQHQHKHDTQRTSYLEEKGFCVLRFWNNEILDDIADILKGSKVHL